MEDTDRDSNSRRGTVVAGLSVGGALLTGAGALYAGFATTLLGDFAAGGIYALAAAVAFGLSANAVLRR